MLTARLLTLQSFILGSSLEFSKCYPVFHVKKWEDIAIDISCAFPEYFNIRKSELGVQMKTSKAFTEGSKVGGNLHCLIEFESL
jgi:hypothetical protein